MSQVLRDKNRVATLEDGKVSWVQIFPSINEAKRFVRTSKLNCRREQFKVPAGVSVWEERCQR